MIHDFSHKLTASTLQWMRNNHLVEFFKQAKNVTELKSMVLKRLFKDDRPDDRFIKGAKLCEWDKVFKILGTLVILFFFLSPVHAEEVVVRYTIRRPASINFAPQSNKPVNQSERADARRVSKTTQQLVNVPKNASTMTKKAPVLVASTNGTTNIEPFKKYLTEKGAKTREIVLAYMSQYYTGDELLSMDNIFKKEAGYRYDAVNEIGACGMGQALPCEKMNCPLTEDGILCQSEWVRNYVVRRYGTPSNAWKFHLENNWY